MDKIKVLFVDDEKGNLNAFKASFRRLFDVFTANSAEQGIQILQEHPIEVVLADQQMPDQTGVDFFERILQTNPNPMRILVTAHSDIEAIIGAINRGQVHRYIHKPWNDSELKLTIENAFQIYLMREQNNKLSLKYKKVFNESSDPILLFDFKGRLIDYNQSTVDILQANDGSLNFTFFRSIIADKNAAMDILLHLKTNESISNYECEIVSQKNIHRNCLVSGNTIRDNHGNVACYQFVLKDITERSKMNKLLLKTIIETQEIERERIAQDLHDGIGQSLAAIKFHLAGYRLKEKSPTTEEYLQLENILNNSIQQLRRICFDTVPSTLSKYGIIRAVDELTKKVSSSDFAIAFHYDALEITDKTLEIALYRIVQEFISNSMKHSGATELKVSFKSLNGNLSLDLIDNGKGFNMEKPLLHRGQGLKNIKTRVESFNGQVDFNSTIDCGTEFNISIPISLN